MLLMAYVEEMEQHNTHVLSSLRCVLLGIIEESKVYKLYNSISKRIIVSRVVALKKVKNGTETNSMNQPFFL